MHTKALEFIIDSAQHFIAGISLLQSINAIPNTISHQLWLLPWQYAMR